jgi:hypothetical protein
VPEKIANLLTIQKTVASRELVGPTSVSGVVLRFGSARVWVQKGGNGDMDQTNVYSPASVVTLCCWPHNDSTEGNSWQNTITNHTRTFEKSVMTLFYFKNCLYRYVNRG